MKISLFIIAILLLSLNISGQIKGLQFGISGGYSKGIMKNSVETFINTKLENDEYFNQNLKFSLGQNIDIGTNINYLFFNKIGISLLYKYNFNSKVVFTEINAIAGVTENNERELSAKRHSIIPTIIINTDFEKLNSFFRIGASFNSTKQVLKETISVYPNTTVYIWDYSGKSGVGFYSEIGLTYNFTDKISGVFGVSFEAYNYIPNSSQITETIINDKSYPDSDRLTIDKKKQFNEWISYQYSQNPDIDNPLQLPKQTFTYNNIGLNIGIIYKL